MPCLMHGNRNYTGGGGSGDSSAVELTYAQYQELTPEQKSDPTKVYYVTDYPSSGIGIEDLTDVEFLLDPYRLQVLMYDGSKWENSDVYLRNLADVEFTNLSDKEFMQYDLNDGWKNVKLDAIDSSKTKTINFTIKDSMQVTLFSGSATCVLYNNGVKHIEVSITKTSSFEDSTIITSSQLGIEFIPKNSVIAYAKNGSNGDYTDGNLLISDTGVVRVEFFDTDSNSITFVTNYV